MARDVGAAAYALDQLRRGWLDPPGLGQEELALRTLTALYNQRPAWPEHAHRELDRAVLAACGWPEDLSDEEVLARLFALGLERAPA